MKCQFLESSGSDSDVERVQKAASVLSARKRISRRGLSPSGSDSPDGEDQQKRTEGILPEGGRRCSTGESIVHSCFEDESQCSASTDFSGEAQHSPTHVTASSSLQVSTPDGQKRIKIWADESYEENESCAGDHPSSSPQSHAQPEWNHPEVNIMTLDAAQHGGSCIYLVPRLVAILRDRHVVVWMVRHQTKSNHKKIANTFEMMMVGNLVSPHYLVRQWGALHGVVVGTIKIASTATDSAHVLGLCREWMSSDWCCVGYFKGQESLRIQCNTHVYIDHNSRYNTHHICKAEGLCARRAVCLLPTDKLIPSDKNGTLAVHDEKDFFLFVQSRTRPDGCAFFGPVAMSLTGTRMLSDCAGQSRVLGNADHIHLCEYGFVEFHQGIHVALVDEFDLERNRTRYDNFLRRPLTDVEKEEKIEFHEKQTIQNRMFFPYHFWVELDYGQAANCQASLDYGQAANCQAARAELARHLHRHAQEQQQKLPLSIVQEHPVQQVRVAPDVRAARQGEVSGRIAIPLALWYRYHQADQRAKQLRCADCWRGLNVVYSTDRTQPIEFRPYSYVR